jgi:hypothetical protein
LLANNERKLLETGDKITVLRDSAKQELKLSRSNTKGFVADYHTPRIRMTNRLEKKSLLAFTQQAFSTGQ